MTIGLLIVRVATLEVTLPQVLENTVRYWLLLCDALTVKLNGAARRPRNIGKPHLRCWPCHCKRRRRANRCRQP